MSVERSSGMKAEAPFGWWWWRESSPRMRWGGWWGSECWRGSVVYERCSERIQLSRPKRMRCYIVPALTMQAHTARAAVGVTALESECITCMLKRMEAEVVGGVVVPKQPHERGGACLVHTSDAAREAFSYSTTGAVMNDWGEPVSSRATRSQRSVAVGPLCTRTSVVNDESSTIRTSPVKHGPCSGIGRW